jgi:protein-S-isoprenylcysteine O-methyltransferase Ste14
MVHSMLASLKAKEMASFWLGPGYKWYRLSYNIFAFITLLPVLALAVILPDKLVYNVPSPWSGLMILLQLAGAVISFIAARQTGLGYLTGLSQLLDKSSLSTGNRLETDGLYKYVRHPIYTGAILFFWAAPQMTWNGMALRLAFTLYFIIGGMVEEKKLVAEFDDAYRAYRLRTPMLIPGLKKSS